MATSRTVFRRGELERRVGHEVVRKNLRAGRWRRLPKVVVTHNGPLAWEERIWAAVLSVADGRAAATRLTALALAGLEAGREHPVHVVLQAGTRRPTVPGVVWSWTSTLAGAVVTGPTEPPRLSVARAVLAECATRGEERSARALVARAVQNRRATTAEFREALGPRPRVRHAAAIREMLGDIDGGIQSVPESDFDGIVRRRRLPPPTRQRRVLGADGRYYLDADWEEYAVSAEVHGVQHWEFAARERDLDRQNDISADGRRVLQFSSYRVRHGGDRVADVLARALRRGGWPGPTRRS